MTLLRRITSNDIERVQAYAMGGLLDRGRIVSKEKVHAAVTHFASSETDFNVGAFEPDGTIVGGIAATVVESPWYERFEAHIVMFRATKAGIGEVLMKSAMWWAKSDMRIGRVLWSVEHDARPGTIRFARMCGLDQVNPLCVGNVFGRT